MRALVLTGMLLCSLSIPALADDQAKPAEKAETGTVKPEGRTHFRLGGIFIGAGYSRYSGRYWGYPYGYYPAYWGAFSPAYYWPFWDLYLPMYYPGVYSPFYSLTPGDGMGEIKLRAERGSEVLLDGAFAGKAEDLKTFWLKPGAYDVEVRAGGNAVLSKRIYVLSGKTLRLEAEARP